MSLVHINRNPSRRSLVWFGLTWLVVFTAVAGCAFLRHGWTASVAALLGLAVLVPAVGWCWPPLMRVVYLTVAYSTFPIGFAVLCLVMAAAYYLILTPLGIALCLCGRDPISRKIEPEARSYWVDRPADPPAERYFCQF